MVVNLPSNAAVSCMQTSALNVVHAGQSSKSGSIKSVGSIIKFEQKNTNPVITRKRRSRHLIREKHLHIAEAAAKLFMEKGYHQTSMREIAKATGMGIGNLYAYISKKEDILYLVLDDCYQRRENYLYGEGVLTSDDPKESLKIFTAQFLKNKIHLADEMMFVQYESRFLPEENREEIMNKEIEYINKLEQIIQKGIDQGVFKVTEAYLAACMMVNQLSMLAMKRWMFERKYPSEDLAILIEDYVLKAVL